jgi:ribosomal protein S19
MVTRRIILAPEAHLGTVEAHNGSSYLRFLISDTAIIKYYKNEVSLSPDMHQNIKQTRWSPVMTTV